MRASFAELDPELFRAINPFKLSILQHLLSVLWVLNWKLQEHKYFTRETSHPAPSTDWVQQQTWRQWCLFVFFKEILPKLVTSTKPVRRLLSETVLSSELVEVRIFLLNY
jgi:hypothetical protein